MADRLRIGVYVTNRGERRLHLGVDDGSENLKSASSLCGLYFMHWSGLVVVCPASPGLLSHPAAVEEMIKFVQNRVHCRRCAKLAQKFRDPITQLGGLT